MIIKRIHWYLFCIIVVGFVLRLIYFILELDIIYSAGTYIRATETISFGSYTSFREPAFPFLSYLIFLITGNSALSTKLISFLFGIIAIPLSYFVFKKTSLKILRNNENSEKLSDYIGLFVSFYYSINADIVMNSAHGLREELITVLLLLIFYFVFVRDDDENLKYNIIIVLLVSLLTLTHLILGIFTFIAIFSCFLILRFNIFNLKFKISLNKMIALSISFLFSLIFWFYHCTIVNNDPFYTITVTRYYERQYSNYMDNNILELFNSIIYGLEVGIFTEFEIFAIEIGFIFILLALFSLIKYHRKKEIFFLSFLILIILLYLCTYIAFLPRPRLLLFLYPFLFFLGFLVITEIWFINKKILITKINVVKRKVNVTINTVFLLFLIFLIIAQFFWHLSQILTIFNQNKTENMFYNLFIDCLLMENIFLMSIILFSYYHK